MHTDNFALLLDKYEKSLNDFKHFARYEKQLEEQNQKDNQENEEILSLLSWKTWKHLLPKLKHFLGCLPEDALPEDALPEDALPNAQQLILELFHYRDAIQKFLKQSQLILIEKREEDPTSEQSKRLVQLDGELNKWANQIVSRVNLEELRKSLKPPASFWWWFLEATPAPDPWWSRADWVWNALSVVAIAIASTNIIITTKAFSKGGFDWLGGLTTVANTTVVLAFAGGALTEKGQKISEEVLTSLTIPKNFHAESTFIVSASFCAMTFILVQNLPVVGAHYYRKGQIYESRLNWESAKEQYQRALNFLPDDPNVYVALGKAYEFLSDSSKAQESYKSAFSQGDPASAIRLTRLLISDAFDETLWEKKRMESVLDSKDEEQKKLKVEREKKLREAKTYLDIALARIMQENTKKQLTYEQPPAKPSGSSDHRGTQNFTSTLDSDAGYFSSQEKSIKDMDLDQRKQLTEIYFAYGILSWAKVNFRDSINKNTKPGDIKRSVEILKNQLFKASNYFWLAKVASTARPPLIDSEDLTQCYVNLAELAKEKIKLYQKRQQQRSEEEFEMPSLTSKLSKELNEIFQNFDNRKKELSNYLWLTENEIDDMKAGQEILKLKLALKEYNYQFISFNSANSCYERLSQQSKLHTNDSRIYRAVLDAKW